MRLENIARDFSPPSDDKDKAIDFSAAGLYIPAVQTVFATVATAGTSVLVCWLVPVAAISAVRTLTLSALSGFLIVRKPINLANTKGLVTIFAALRPCCFIYIFCMILEQLIHTCISEEVTYESGFWRRVVYHSAVVAMTVAAFLRSCSPRSESDISFAISIAALLVIAALPPPALALSGPLCSPATLAIAAERVVRAFTFSSVYVVLVYSAAPISSHLADTAVCIARSAAASAWVLGSVVYMLPLALVQVSLLLYFSFAARNLQYAGVDVSAADVETAEVEPVKASEEPDKDVLAALSMFKGGDKKKPCFQSVDSKRLTFSIPQAVSCSGAD